ncbi:MAG: TolC family protein [Agriterribacter sp.]
MRRSLFLFATVMVVAASLTVQAQDAGKWDLRRVVEYAMEKNINVRQVEITARTSAIDLKQSKLDRYPSLNFSGGHGFSFGRSLDYSTNVYTDNNLMYEQMGLSSQVTIFNWNSKNNLVKANSFTNQADVAAIDKAKNDVALDAARQYLVVLMDKEQVEITSVQLQQSKAQLSNTRKLVDAGSLPELNAAELEAQVARDSASLITAQTQVEADRLTLKSILSLPADVPFELETPPVDKIPIDNILEISPAEVYTLAMNTQPQVKVNNLRLKAAEKSYLVSRARQYPTISISGQLGSAFNSSFKSLNAVILADQVTPAYALNGTDKYYIYSPQTGYVTSKKNFGQLWDGYGSQLKNNFGQGISIGLNVPIFNGWSARANVERSKWVIDARKLTIEQDTLALKQNVYSAYNLAMGAFQTYIANQKAVATAEKSFDLATKRYNIGVMQTIEWLTNQTALFNAKINLVRSQFDYVFKMKVLEYYKGLGLRL